MNRLWVLVAGIGAVLAVTWLLHSPFGAAQRFIADVETAARAQLDHDEMLQVRARLQRDPLHRRLILSGPADDFQRREIKRRMELIPGVGEAQWAPASRDMEPAR